MYDKVKEILERLVENDATVITPDSKLVKDLGLSSLDLVNAVVEFEEAFDIEVPDADIQGFQTVGDIVEYLEDKSK